MSPEGDSASAPTFLKDSTGSVRVVGMKTNRPDLQRKPDGDETMLPDDLTCLLPPGELLQRSLEAVQTFFWSTRPGAATPVVAGTFNPRVLLTLLTYSYATGVFATQRIVELCEHDDVFRYLSMGIGFAADRIRLFRGQNSELLKRCIAFVIRHATDAAQTPVPGSANPTDARAAFRKLVFSQRDAERRIKLAIKVDQEVHVPRLFECC